MILLCAFVLIVHVWVAFSVFDWQVMVLGLVARFGRFGIVRMDFCWGGGWES